MHQGIYHDLCHSTYSKQKHCTHRVAHNWIWQFFYGTQEVWACWTCFNTEGIEQNQGGPSPVD